MIFTSSGFSEKQDRPGGRRTGGVAELPGATVDPAARGLRLDPVKVVIDPGRGGKADPGAAGRGA